jgi:hypothetical protein
MAHSGNFIWYELLTSDTEAAEDFYTHVVGWGAQDSGQTAMKYTLLTVDKVAVAGLMKTPEGCATDNGSMWSGYIMVDDVDKYATLVKDAGGKILMEPQDIPNVGRFAIAADPLGTPFQLFKPSMQDRGDYPAQFTPGTIGWHELHSTDWERAFGFYSGLFGWTKGEAMDMGPMGTYQIFNVDGQMYGGMMNSTEPSNPKVWRFYFIVDDIDSAEKRVKAKGGQVLFGPDPVPGGGYILQGRDPQGAFFALTGPRI